MINLAVFRKRLCRLYTLQARSLAETFDNNMMDKSILPKEFSDIKESVYAGFELRAEALIMDSLIYLPIFALCLVLNKIEKSYLIYTSIFSFGFYVFYNVFLVYRFEGTPGKRKFKIKIKKKNGQRIGVKEALLREIVSLTLIGVLRYAYVVTALKMPDIEYDYQTFNSLKPFWYSFVDWTYNIWIMGEIIVLLLNKRKRALHDYIGGTVVIKDKFENVVEQFAAPDSYSTTVS